MGKNWESLRGKIFARLLSRKAEPWAGLSPYGRQSKVSVRILGEIGSDFVQKVPH